MKINSNIKAAMLSLLNDETTVSSWGLSDISVSAETLAFHVEGLRYAGKVIIRPGKSGCVEIEMGGKSISDCAVSNIVGILDRNIERTDNYQEDLNDWIQGVIPHP